MVIALLICIFIIEIYIYKKSDKKYVSPQGYDYIVTFKDVEVGDKMLDQHIQEVFKCRRNGIQNHIFHTLNFKKSNNTKLMMATHDYRLLQLANKIFEIKAC